MITGHDPRACLFFDIKLCQGPCIGDVDQAQYRAMIDDLSRFLRGHTEPVVARLRTEMARASGTAGPRDLQLASGGSAEVTQALAREIAARIRAGLGPAGQGEG